MSSKPCRTVLLLCCSLFIFSLTACVTQQSSNIHAAGKITVLAMPDLNKYCGFLKFKKVVLDPPGTAYNLHCVDAHGVHHGISMKAACIWQYKSSAIIERVGNVGDPKSWRCLENAAFLANPNFLGYCISIGNVGFVILRPYAAYDIHCVDRKGNVIPYLSVKLACDYTQKQLQPNQKRDVIERLKNFNGSSTHPPVWECYENAT